MVDDPAEECDDGNTDDTDGCTSNCKVKCDGQDEFEDPATKHCYRYAKVGKNWMDASSDCQGWNGDLAALSTTTEQLFIAMRGFNATVWIGGTDAAMEGTWVWTNGETWTKPAEAWAKGEPSNSGPGGENCLEIRPDNVTWNDDGCWKPFYFLCERSPGL
jgi:cysteine-rich repeat protein